MPSWPQGGDDLLDEGFPDQPPLAVQIVRAIWVHALDDLHSRELEAAGLETPPRCDGSNCICWLDYDDPGDDDLEDDEDRDGEDPFLVLLDHAGGIGVSSRMLSGPSS